MINILPSVVDKSADESEGVFILLDETTRSRDCVVRGCVPYERFADIDTSVGVVVGWVDEDDDV
jgi:hypothetical protein